MPRHNLGQQALLHSTVRQEIVRESPRPAPSNMRRSIAILLERTCSTEQAGDINASFNADP
jgi:hypothetical protein